MNIQEWKQQMLRGGKKKATPVLSFPSVQLMGITVRELISSAESQSRGMKLIADRVDSAASVSLMDLSVEAEAFGAEVRFSDDEIPTVVGARVTSEEEAEALSIPAVGTARTGIYIDAVRRAKELITDRPVFSGVVGPYSLTGRLLDVSEAMVLCYEEPNMVHAVLRKATDFLIAYINAYKAVGADGVVMAEPLAGMLSPALCEEFSAPYVKEIVDAVKSEDFLFIYHNCGNNVPLMADAVTSCGADAYHFGNAIDLAAMIPHSLWAMWTPRARSATARRRAFTRRRCASCAPAPPRRTSASPPAATSRPSPRGRISTPFSAPWRIFTPKRE